MADFKLKHKLALFWFGSVLCSLSVLGVMFSYFTIELHETRARQQIQEGFEALHVFLDVQKEHLGKNAAQLAGRDDIVASVSMIQNYQDGDHYESYIFDGEKKMLARELAEYGGFEGRELMAVYDAGLKLSSFFKAGGEGAGFIGYTTYRSGRISVLSTLPGREDFQESTLLPPTLEKNPFAPRNGQSSVALYVEGGHLLMDGFSPIIRQFPSGAEQWVGLARISRPLDAQFAELISQQTRLGFAFSTAEGKWTGNLEGAENFQLEEEARHYAISEDMEWRWIEHPDYYLGLHFHPLEFGRALFVFGIEKTHLQMELATFRKSILLTLILGGVLIFPMGIYTLQRAVTGPVSFLVKGVEKLKKGDYDALPNPPKQGELGYLFKAFNEMAESIREREGELKQLSEAVEQSPVSVVITDPKGTIEYVNRRFSQITGYSAEEAVGNNPRLLKSDHTAPEEYRKLWRTISSGEIWRGVFLNRKKSGELFWESATISPIKGPEGSIAHYVGVKEDITRRKQFEEERQRFRLAIDTSPDCIFLIDPEDMRLMDFNQTVLRVMGYSRDELLQMGPQDLEPDYSEEELRLILHQVILSKDRTGRLETEHRRKDGSQFPVDIHLGALQQKKGEWVIIALARDITERKQAERQIERQAFYDALTDLPNRRLLYDRLEQELVRAKRGRHTGAVLFLDLDNFKVINDSLGHQVGDGLVRYVATCLIGNLREEDTAARLGGDEFVILLSQLDSNPKVALNETQVVVNKIRDALTKPCNIEGHELHITASIGISLFLDNHESADDVLRQADIAMYRAKEKGRNTFQFYMPVMQTAVTERLTLETELRQAIRTGGLELHYQPQLNVSGRVVGAECLLRWPHPKKGMISPAKFVPIAEDTGLILEIGRWVLHHACNQLKAWQNSTAGQWKGRMALNISPRQFIQHDFVQQIRATLDETGTDPERLELELTEGMLISNLEETIEKMNALKRLGIRFSIDDFGTGYSSLSYLKRLPLDQLKIDQSFVHDITTDPSDAAIVDTIIAVAHHMDLEVIAEGVESEMQLEFLREKGCENYQGYYFSRPVSPDEFIAFIRDRD